MKSMGGKESLYYQLVDKKDKLAVVSGYTDIFPFNINFAPFSF